MLETVQEWLLVITNNPKPIGNQFCKAYKRYSGGPNGRFRSVRFIRTESLWSKRSKRGHPTSQNVLQCVLRDQPCIRIVFARVPSPFYSSSSPKPASRFCPFETDTQKTENQAKIMVYWSESPPIVSQIKLVGIASGLGMLEGVCSCLERKITKIHRNFRHKMKGLLIWLVWPTDLTRIQKKVDDFIFCADIFLFFLDQRDPSIQSDLDKTLPFPMLFANIFDSDIDGIQ